VDDKDLKILEVLKQNARFSIQDIAKRSLLPITTVYNRMKRLEAEGIITGYTVQVDKRKLGRLVDAFVLATVDYKELHDSNQEYLAAKLGRMTEVEGVSIMAGETDLIIAVSVSSVEALNTFVIEKLRKVQGIDKTKTLVVLKRF
jgi:DNA-binding Lrp family transcriptional regulator